MKRTINREAGFSIIELTVTISLAAVMTGFSALSMTEMTNPVRHGAMAIASYVEMARAQAISSTSTIIVKPVSTGQIQGFAASSCSDSTPQADSELLLTLASEYSLSDLSWELCFSPRGFASSSRTIPLIDVHDETQNVEVFVGGGVRIS